MTIQEVLKWIKTIKGLYKPLLKEANEACDVAIQALEKQIPKKVEYDGKYIDNGFTKYRMGKCTNCGR